MWLELGQGARGIENSLRMFNLLWFVIDYSTL